MEVNAVFEGGGVKAIALVGAIHQAEKSGFSFHKVAGTSSGSLVASLIAAGYSANEMKKLILETPFQRFLQQSWLVRIKFIGPITRLILKKGLYSGEYLEHWVYQKLSAKGIRSFGDLKPNQLKIIASDISDGKLLVLPDDISRYGINPDRFSVAKAVRMSTSIPFFFDPVMIRRNLKTRLPFRRKFKNQFAYIVDGGVLSNFPLWVFDKQEINQQTGKQFPTLGFQLVGKNQTTSHEIYGPISMYHALFSTMMDAHDERYIENHNRFRTIKIPTLGVRTTEFEINREKSLALFSSGEKAAQQFFQKWSKDQYKHQFEKLVTARFKS